MIGGAAAPAVLPIDLGLPSGTLWADKNIGAYSRSDAGLYFSWGNTVGHEYNSGYPFTAEEYALTEGATIVQDLPISHDAAAVRLGNDWRMPSNELWQELINYCQKSVVTIDGVVCFVLTSEFNGEVLVLPASGSIIGTQRSGFGQSALIPSTTYSSSSACNILFVRVADFRLSGTDRSRGLAIRACIPGTI